MRRIALFACLLFAACSNDDGAAIDDFVQQIATQQCSWEFRCCTDAEIKMQDGHKFTTEDACLPYRKLALEDELYASRAAARAGRLKLDRDQANKCVAAMQAQACNGAGQTSSATAMQSVDACSSVFVGAAAPGEACLGGNECAAGARCVFDKTSPTAEGVCVPYQRENDVCNGADDCDPSVPELYCAQQDWKCHRRGRVGDPCAFTIDATGKPTTPLLLECDPTVGFCDATTSTCKALPGAGEPCLSPLPLGASAACNPDPSLRLACELGVCTVVTDAPPPTPTGGVCSGR